MRQIAAKLHRRAFRFLLVLAMALIIVGDFGSLERIKGQSVSTCDVTYNITTQWNTGFQAEVTVINNGPAINGWTVTWAFPANQTISELWNGSYTQSGPNVTVTNASYNGNLPAGGRVSFGFNASWSGSNPLPTVFTLNGQTCGETTPTILTSASSLSVNEGASAQFGVSLSAAPAGNVTVSVARLSGDADLTVTAGATLTFTPGNFATIQNVTISAAEDADQTGGTAIFRVSAAGSPNVDLNVSEVDNDTAAISIMTNIRRSMAVVEGSSAQFGVRLASAPPANVTVTVARMSGDTDLTVTSGATLTFTPANFATYQNVTISAAEDADITNGTAMFRIAGTGLTDASANVSEFDNDGLPVARRTYVATLTGAGEVPPVITSATGVATVILSPDETAALVSLSFANLSSPQTAAHINGPAEPGNSAEGNILLDPPLGQLSNMLWTFGSTGALTAQDLVNALKTGRLYANVHSSNFPGGEIRGWLFVLDDGNEDLPNDGGGGFGDAYRLLEQATFGPTVAEANRVLEIGFDAWLNEQFAATSSNYQNLVQLQQGQFVKYPVQLQFFRNAMTGQDQLRQRVAFALSQIVVAADVGNQDGDGDPTAMVSQYHDILLRNAFGNYRTLLREMMVSPILGTYLTVVNSKKSNPATGEEPDENLIREFWQLFTVGTYRLNIDGSVQLDAQQRPLETYTIAEIQEGARALTGWNYAPRAGQPNQGDNNPLNPFAAMIPNPANHDTGEKMLLGGQMIPAGQTVEQDLNSVIDNAFNHPNVGPFIGRQLIQHLVTGNPSSAYIARVAAVFNDNGQGVRGDLRAVVRAILLDPEARGNSKSATDFGKLREPALFLTHLFRSLNCTGGMWGIPQRSRGMGQDIFSPPSVFSYFQPDFRVVINGQPIYAPTAQLLSTSSIIQRMNLLNDLLFSNIQAGGNPNPTGSNGTTVMINLAPWDQLAANPAQLVDGLNEALLHNSMSPQMRQVVINAVNSIQNNNRQRVQTAIYIIAASMQYQVQR